VCIKYKVYLSMLPKSCTFKHIHIFSSEMCILSGRSKRIMEIIQKWVPRSCICVTLSDIIKSKMAKKKSEIRQCSKIYFKKVKGTGMKM